MLCLIKAYFIISLINRTDEENDSRNRLQIFHKYACSLVFKNKKKPSKPFNQNQT